MEIISHNPYFFNYPKKGLIELWGEFLIETRETKFFDDKGVILGILDHQPGKKVLFVYHQLGLSYVVELGGGVDRVLLRSKSY